MVWRLACGYRLVWCHTVRLIWVLAAQQRFAVCLRQGGRVSSFFGVAMCYEKVINLRGNSVPASDTHFPSLSCTLCSFPTHLPHTFALYTQAVSAGLLPPIVQHIIDKRGAEWCEFAPLSREQRLQRAQQGWYMRPVVWFR